MHRMIILEPNLDPLARAGCDRCRRPAAGARDPHVADLVAAHAAREHVISLPVGPAPYAAVVDTGAGRYRVDATGAPISTIALPPRRDGARQPVLVGDSVVPVPRLPDRALPALTDIRRDNPRMQGQIGLGDAVGWFAAHGFVVSIPLVDSQRYDLIVDDGEQLQRVQVKTTTVSSPYGVPIVGLKTAGGNQSFTTRRPFDPTEADVLYVLVEGGRRFVVPTAVIQARITLSLGDRVRDYEVP